MNKVCSCYNKWQCSSKMTTKEWSRFGRIEWIRFSNKQKRGNPLNSHSRLILLLGPKRDGREKENIAAGSPILFIGCIIRHYQPTHREVKSKRTPLLPSAIISDFCRHLAAATIGTDGGGEGGDSSVSVSSSFPGPN